ncbi:hypothetical protein BGW80DRAFT_771732 [Lactifluus volemus]|nr:hypothetical protein BGW80DRAFT_771732 [Lactifluus volemus]
MSPILGHERRHSTPIDKQSSLQPLDEVRWSECNRKNHDRGEPSSYQKVFNPLRSSPVIRDGRLALKALSNGSRVGTVEERMSREVETFIPGPRSPVSPVPVVRDEVVSPGPSRKRRRPAYLESSDDEDPESDNTGRLCTGGNIPETGKDQLSAQTDSDDIDLSDSDSGKGGAGREQRVSSRASSKPSGKHKARRYLDDGLEREYFSPSGVKLEVIELPVKYDTKEWLKHVEQCPEGSKTPWRCTWQTMKNGTPVPCDYSSKKHLVKRHIEATHLCIKRFQCTWCEKTFTQRSNVAGCHLNTHTGASPHGCDFCGDRFKDPSKRHKHMLRNHGYRPGESRKKFKSDESAQGQSVHESLEPWKVADPGDC